MDINRITIVGHMGKDPEGRSMPNGDRVVRFSVATTEKWTKNGEKQERTEWHNCEAFGKLAEIIEQYGTKGRLVYLEGAKRTDEYEDKATGVKMKACKIVLGFNSVFSLLGAQGDAPAKGRSGTAEQFVATDDDIPF